MAITIDFKSKDELDKYEIKRLKSLTLHHGMMMKCFKKHDDCSVILAIDKGLIIGWGLVFEDDGEEANFHVYVSKYRRREGIGTQIFEMASEIFPDGLIVFKWNKESQQFYNNFNVIEEDIYDIKEDEKEDKLDEKEGIDD